MGQMSLRCTPPPPFCNLSVLVNQGFLVMMLSLPMWTSFLVCRAFFITDIYVENENKIYVSFFFLCLDRVRYFCGTPWAFKIIICDCYISKMQNKTQANHSALTNLEKTTCGWLIHFKFSVGWQINRKR